jgi:hypothetical protein
LVKATEAMPWADHLAIIREDRMGNDSLPAGRGGVVGVKVDRFTPS